MRTCKICSEKFEPKKGQIASICHEPSCIIENYKRVKEKKRSKEWSKEKAERKDKLMTLSDWIQLLQPIFNRYIVLRDREDCCISCRTTKNVQYCASHYYNTKTYGNLRFTEDNVHKACNRYCNGEMSGNLIPYREYLIKKIGQERFDALVAQSNVPRHYTIPEIKDMIKLYRAKIRELSK